MKKIILVLFSFIIVQPLLAQTKQNEAKKKINLFDIGYTQKDPQSDFTEQLSLEKRRIYLNQHQNWPI